MKNDPDGSTARSVLCSISHIQKLGYCPLSITQHIVGQRPFWSTVFPWLSTAAPVGPIQRLHFTETSILFGQLQNSVSCVCFDDLPASALLFHATKQGWRVKGHPAVWHTGVKKKPAGRDCVLTWDPYTWFLLLIAKRDVHLWKTGVGNICHIKASNSHTGLLLH